MRGYAGGAESLDAMVIQAAHRLAPRVVAGVRAKADMEGVTVTDTVRKALEAYAASSPGAKVTYVARRPR